MPVWPVGTAMGVDLPRALAVLVQICDGLGAAHAVGVVHRDLKPDNVIVVPTSDGAELVKLLDFGVAKLLNRDDEDVGFQTAAGSVIGTPAYMSPEQAGGMAVDHRSDIYSLGAIMYELFCGQPMFRGRSFGEYVRKHLTEHPDPAAPDAGRRRDRSALEALILQVPRQGSERAVRPHPRAARRPAPHARRRRDASAGVRRADEQRDQPADAAPGRRSCRARCCRWRRTAMVSTVPTPAVAVARLVADLAAHPLAVVGQLLVALQPATAQRPSRRPSRRRRGGCGSSAARSRSGSGSAARCGTRTAATEPAPAVIVAHGCRTPSPSTAPIAERAGAAPKPKLVELRFDSLPSGGVYADGHSAELCQTPCASTSTSPTAARRIAATFVVRATATTTRRSSSISPRPARLLASRSSASSRPADAPTSRPVEDTEDAPRPRPTRAKRRPRRRPVVRSPSKAHDAEAKPRPRPRPTTAKTDQAEEPARPRPSPTTPASSPSRRPRNPRSRLDRSIRATRSIRSGARSDRLLRGTS